MSEVKEKHASLWILTIAPSTWGLHFLLSYGTAAVFCAKVGGSLEPVRLAIAVYTAVALGGIAMVLLHGYRKHTFGKSALPHDFDTAEDRHRFLGFATVLLSVLSAVATIYVSLTVLFIETCR